MKVLKTQIKKTRETVYDFETPSHSYILGNGIISHNTQEMFSKQVVSGGTGVMYSSNTVWIIGRSQDKEGTELVGYNFTINVEKSRFVREKSKLPFTVSFEGGINRYSGLLDLALECGLVKKPSNGWYSHVDIETGVISDKKYREADTNSKEFFAPILGNKKFYDFVKSKYQLAVNPIQINNEDD